MATPAPERTRWACSSVPARRARCSVAHCRTLQRYDRSVALLIINGDDWGLKRDQTDAILACYRARRVTSASGMVYMADSARAAALARDDDVPVGLHLNLAEVFDASDIDPDVQDRQRRLVGHLSRGVWHRWGFAPTLRATVDLAIADQFAEFLRLYGRPPTHVDGHEHLHTNLTVLLSRELPAGMKMRPSFTFARGEKPWINRAMRASTNRIARRRHPGPTYFVSIRRVHPALGGSGFDALDRFADGAVEVMTHPGWPDEFEALMSEEWRAALERRRLGSYRDL